MAERSGQKTRNGKGDLNRAGRDELTAIPGIGPATAEAILKSREQRGAFESLDQLGDVAGLGTQAAKNLRKRFTVSGKRAGSGGRSAGGAAKRAAESARQAGENAGETTRRTAEKSAQVARDMGEPGANVAAEAGRSNVAEAKAAGAEAADAIRSSAREAGTGSKEAGEQAQKGAESLAASTDGTLESMLELQREWLSCVQAQLEDTLAAGQDLARCRSPKDLIDVQLRYARASMERFVTQSAKLAGLGARVAGTGLPSLQSAMRRGTTKPEGRTRS